MQGKCRIIAQLFLPFFSVLLYINYYFRNNNTWIIGSSDISLEINLKNHGEPAYLATLEFMFPEGVVLRSILPSCLEDMCQETLIVVCDAGNPIWKGEEVGISQLFLFYIRCSII